ncbi:MAG: PHP domain-containing protein [Chloroflexi bacterium]|nr:PHP domain-containing protein [Chloroflexota bacterium]
MPIYRAELHVHTVLSPCAGVEMIPPVIVEEALKHGINLIAITDHNSTANGGAVMEAALGTGLTVLPGMELQTQEEVHVLCLFDGLEQAQAWQRTVDSKFPDLLNDEEKIGEQYIVDATGCFIRKEERMLISNIAISLEEAVELVNRLGGIVIPAHVERRAYGLLGVLGFASPIFEALEVSHHVTIAEASRLFPDIEKFPVLQNGDVHSRDGFLGLMEFEMQAPTVAEIRRAIRGVGERRMRIISAGLE